MGAYVSAPVVHCAAAAPPALAAAGDKTAAAASSAAAAGSASGSLLPAAAQAAIYGDGTKVRRQRASSVFDSNSCLGVCSCRRDAEKEKRERKRKETKGLDARWPSNGFFFLPCRFPFSSPSFFLRRLPNAKTNQPSTSVADYMNLPTPVRYEELQREVMSEFGLRDEFFFLFLSEKRRLIVPFFFRPPPPSLLLRRTQRCCSLGPLLFTRSWLPPTRSPSPSLDVFLTHSSFKIPRQNKNKKTPVSLKPDLFEGLRFDFTKPFNQNFALCHSFFLGNVEVPSQSGGAYKMAVGTYEFGANLVSQTGDMMIGRVMTDGRLTGRVKKDLLDDGKLSAKVQAQLSPESSGAGSQVMLDLDSRGSDWNGKKE